MIASLSARHCPISGNQSAAECWRLCRRYYRLGAAHVVIVWLLVEIARAW